MNRHYRTIATAGSLGLALALGLAGCGSKDGNGNGAPKTAAEVEKEAAKLVKPLPGEYRQVTEVTQLDVPGLPREAAAQMKNAMKASQEGTFCLTKADAERGFKNMFNDVGKGNQCTYTKFDVDGGKLDAQMDCEAPQTQQGEARQGPSQERHRATMKMNGTLAETGTDVTIDMDTTGGPPPMGSMKMTMHMTTKRVGECKGS